MHWDTFLLAFTIFAVFGLVLPIAIAEVADRARVNK